VDNLAENPRLHPALGGKHCGQASFRFLNHYYILISINIEMKLFVKSAEK